MLYQIPDIKSALICTQSVSEQEKKIQALQFLEQFQKSIEAWQICFEVLSKHEADNLQLQMFACQTLVNKVTYDLNQVNTELESFKGKLFEFIAMYEEKIIVTQLNVALARFTIQYLDWRNPLVEIINTLNGLPGKLLLFLKILPEETLDIKSTPLSQDEFECRTHELIDNIGEDVLKFLISCLDRVGTEGISASKIISCFGSWCYEFPIEQVLQVTPLINTVFQVLHTSYDTDSDSFEAAVECLCVLLRETRDAANDTIIHALYEQLLALQQKLLPITTISDWEEYEEIMDPLTRLFVETGEAWCVFLAKNPALFKPLVEVILVLTCKNTDLDIVSYTFPFWFNLRQMLVLQRYAQQRKEYQDVFINLTNGLITHLHYPETVFENKEDEDKFKDFRYNIGDVLKSCAAVLGSTVALQQPYNLINQYLQKEDPNTVWQPLEAALFAVRTMAHEISHTENVVLPQLFKQLCIHPLTHPKLVYSTILVFSRYTEWTSKHEDLLEIQLNYIFNGFEAGQSNHDLSVAASNALMYFCQDCSSLLVNYCGQLVDFIWKIEPAVDNYSMFEMCQGLSSVINEQETAKIGGIFNSFTSQHNKRFDIIIQQFISNPSDPDLSAKVAHYIDLLYAILENIVPKFEYPEQGVEEPLIASISEHITKLINLLDAYAISNVIIVDRTMKFFRRVFEKYHLFTQPILPAVSEFVAKGYSTSGLGAYLWFSGSIIYVYGDDEYYPVDVQVKEAVWQFACQQCSTFFNNFKSMQTLDKFFEMVHDFFLMCNDLLMFFPEHMMNTPVLISSLIQWDLESLPKLDNFEAYMTLIRFLDDLSSWGFKTPPISVTSITEVPDAWRCTILEQVVSKNGSNIVTALINGLVTNFDSRAHQEIISLIVKIFRLATENNNNDPSVCLEWLDSALRKMGTIESNERSKLMSIGNALIQRDYRRCRGNIKDFIDWYLRKHISSRMYT